MLSGSFEGEKETTRQHRLTELTTWRIAMLPLVRHLISGTSWKMLLALGVGISLPTLSPTPAKAAERIVVNIYSGVWSTVQRACIIDPFNKLNNGIEVVSEPGVSSVTLTKLRQQKDKPEIDVAWLDGNFSEDAFKDGLVEGVDASAVPNVANYVPEGLFKDKTGKYYAFGTGFYSTGIMYRTKDFKEAPTSWWDLWKPEYSGRVIVPSPAQAIFIPLFLHINKLLGGNNSNFEPGLNKFHDLKVAAYFDSTGVVQSSMESGEALLGANYINSTWSMADQGMAVAAIVPKEGVPAGDTRIHLVKNAPHRDAALKFINFAISPESLNCLGEKLYLGPPLKTPQLSDNAKKKMPWGENGSVANLILPDWNEIIAKRGDIVEQWNRRVVNK
jgi:putative spermidine/putrescine transport system substrate-binding protein